MTALLEYLDRDCPVSGNLAGVHVMTIAQYSFKFGVLSTLSKIVGGTGAPPTPPLLPPMLCDN